MFKNIAYASLAVLALITVSLTTHAGQNFTTNVAQFLNSGYITYLQTDNQGALLSAQGASTALDVATSSVIQSGPGRVAHVSVLVAGSAGGLYDSATVASAAAANELVVIPATQGNYSIDLPFTNGLVYEPGASQTASIGYNK